MCSCGLLRNSFPKSQGWNLNCCPIGSSFQNGPPASFSNTCWQREERSNMAGMLGDGVCMCGRGVLHSEMALKKKKKIQNCISCLLVFKITLWSHLFLILLLSNVFLPPDSCFLAWHALLQLCPLQVLPIFQD